jgi:uncharacterized protein involved in outer membrane biogenesis
MRAVKWILLGLVVLIAAAVVALLTVDVNRFKPQIVAAVENATGRKLEIAGDLELKIFPLPAVAVNGVTFANAPWGSRPHMATIGEFAAEPDLFALLRRQIKIDRLVLSDVDLLLEKNRQGQANWEFAAKSEAKPAAPQEQKAAGDQHQVSDLPVISNVLLKNVKLAHRDAQSGASNDLLLNELSVKEQGSGLLATRLVAVINTHRVEAEGTLGSLAELSAPSRPWPVKMTVRVPGATATVDGTLAQPMLAKGIDLNVGADVPDLAKMASAFGASAPAVPVKLQTKIKDSGAQRYAFSGLTAALAQSDLAGSGEIALGGTRPSLKLDLASKSFDVTSLLDTGGSNAPAGGGGSSGGTSASAAKSDGRVFSDEPLPLDGLTAVDAVVAYKADRFVAPKFEAQNLSLNLTLKDGVLTVKPVGFGLAGGTINGDITLNGGAKTLAVKLTTAGVVLSDYLQKNEITDIVRRGAPVDIDLDVTSRGGSVRQLMAGLNGKAVLKVGKGELKEEYMQRFLPKLADAVGVLGRATAKTDLYCVVTGLDIKNGVATPKAFLAETGRITIAGDGSVNLGSEQLDLRLVPSSRSVSLASALPAVRVRGSFTDPSFAPDPAALAKSVIGTAAGVAALGPLALLSPALGDRGDSAETACTKAIALAEGKATPQSLQSSQPQQQQQNSNPVDNLRRGLGNLLGR